MNYAYRLDFAFLYAVFAPFTVFRLDGIGYIVYDFQNAVGTRLNTNTTPHPKHLSGSTLTLTFIAKPSLTPSPLTR